MRKYSLLLVTLLVLLLTGTAAAEVVELRVWAWLPGSVNGDIFAKYIAEFEASHPNIRVTVERGSNESQLLVAYAGGAAPDLTQGVGPWATSLGPKGILMPLDDFIDGPNGFPRKDFIDDLWSFSIVNGKTYQLASDSNERALFVSAEIAGKSGVDVSQPMRDWNDLLAWARKMTKRTGDNVEYWGYDVNQENGGGRWNWVWLNEGEIFSKDGTQALLDNPNTVEALQFASDMINSWGVAPPPGSGASKTQFRNGKFSMITTASTFVNELELAGIEFYTIPGPPGPGKGGYRFSGATSSMMGIVSSTKHPEEAWTFLRWLMYEKGVDFANDRKGIPYLLKGLRSEQYMKQPWNAFATSIMTFQPRNGYVTGLSESDWTSHFQSAWDAVMKNQAAPLTALRQAQEVINVRLAEIHAQYK
jgi:multiple sugar transport system substrate-binding protein